MKSGNGEKDKSGRKEEKVKLELDSHNCFPAGECLTCQSLSDDDTHFLQYLFCCAASRCLSGNVNKEYDSL